MTTTTVKILPKPTPVMVLGPPQQSVAQVEGSPRGRKGKNFIPEEECLLCRSFLAVSQGPVPENGQKIASMWERVAASFNDKNQAYGLASRSARSLESKWCTIKHDVSIFVTCHASVESGSPSSEDVIEKALELYRSKHPRGATFIHLRCWTILHEVPQWCEEGVKVVLAQAKAIEPERDEEEPISRTQEDNSNRSEQQRHSNKRLRRVKGAVDKEAKARECALLAQARAMADMAAASRMKAEILADQSALHLFTLPLKDVTEPDAREYLMLRRQEEISKMRLRRLLAQSAAQPIHLLAAPTSAAIPEQLQSLKQPTTNTIESLFSV